MTDSAVDLDQLYDPPSGTIVKGVMPRLLPFHIKYLEVATFFCLASGNANGLDASPRGGEPGFVHVLDEKTVAFADWPGNNRIDSLRNINDNSRIGMLFLFPGLEVFLRINGHARISRDETLLLRLQERGRIPKTAIHVTIDEVFLHCGKAVNRAQLWRQASRIEPTSVPSLGEMKAAMTGENPTQTQALDADYYREIRGDLY